MVYPQRPFKGLNKKEILKSIHEGLKLNTDDNNSDRVVSLHLRNFLSFVSTTFGDAKLCLVWFSTFVAGVCKIL